MARTLLDAQKFFENGYRYANGGIGLNADSTGMRGVDCSGLVYQMARTSGYNVPRFATGDLLDASGHIKPGASRFYLLVDRTDLQPGDILVFAPDGHTSGHVGVYRQGEVDGTRFTGEFFGAQTTGGIKVEKVDDKQYWSGRTVLGIIRPRADRYDPALDQTQSATVDLAPKAIAPSVLARQVTRLTDREFEVFKEAIASVEAKGHENDPGGWTLTDKSDTHWGRYQMGKDALIDAGFMDRRGNWIKPGIDSKAAFLNSPEAQDEALRNLADKNADWAVKNNYDLRIGETLGGNEVTKIGLLMSEHHERGSTAKYMNSGGEEDKLDSNGVGPGHYLSIGAQATREAGLSAGEPYTGIGLVPFAPAQNSLLTGQSYPRVPYPGDGIVTRNPDGSITYSGTAREDSPSGQFSKGDQTSQTYDKDGKLISVTVYDKNTGEARSTSLPDSLLTEEQGNPLYLASDGGTYRYRDGLFTNTATGETRETLPTGASKLLPPDTWIISQPDQSAIRYEILPDNGWKLTYTDAAGNPIETTQTLPDGGWIKIDTNGNLIEGYDSQDLSIAIQTTSAIPDEATDGEAIKVGLNQIEFDGHHYFQQADGTYARALGQGQWDVLDPLELERRLETPYRIELLQPGQTIGLSDTGVAIVLTRHQAVTAQANFDGFSELLGNPPPSAVDVPDGLDTETDAFTTGALGQGLDPNKAGTGFRLNGLTLDQGQVLIEQQREAIAARSENDYRRETAAAGSIQSALNLIQSIQNGNSLGILANGVNLIDNLSRANNIQSPLPSEIGYGLGALGSGLNLINTLEDGDTLSIVSSGLNFANTVSQGAVAAGIGQSLGMNAANVMPAIGIVVGLAQGNPISALAAAANLIPGYGQIFSIAMTVLGTLFVQDEEPPEISGGAIAAYDSQGHLIARIDPGKDNRNEGAEQAVHTLQNLLDGIQDALPAGFALIPQRLPSLGYHSQTETHLLLGLPDGSDSWIQSGDQQRIGQDYIERSLANQAIVTQAEADTIQIRLERDPNAWKTDPAAMTEIDAEGVRQSLRVVTVALTNGTVPERRETWFDTDGDGWLEKTSWTNQAVLVLDRDGNGLIGNASELISTDSGHDSLAWLDANGDGRFDARDPAYSAVRLWQDINGDGVSQTDEMIGLSEAGIDAFTLEADGIHVCTADGELTASEQHLAGKVIGERWQNAEADGIDIGILHDTEEGAHELYSTRTHDYTGEEGHSHGGEASATVLESVTVEDRQIVNAGGGVFVQVHAEADRVEGDEGINSSGRSGMVLEGQGAGQREIHIGFPADGTQSPTRLESAAPDHANSPALKEDQTAIHSQLNHLGVEDTPTVAQALRRVTRDMIRSSNGLLQANGLLAGLALGATAQAGEQLLTSNPASDLNVSSTPALVPAWHSQPTNGISSDHITQNAATGVTPSSSGQTSQPIADKPGTGSIVDLTARYPDYSPQVAALAQQPGTPSVLQPTPGSQSGHDTNDTGPLTAAPASTPRTLRAEDVRRPTDNPDETPTLAPNSDQPGTNRTGATPSAPSATAVDPVDALNTPIDTSNITDSVNPPDRTTTTPLNLTPALPPVGTQMAQPYVYIPLAPLVENEDVDGDEDQPLLIDPALLLANDLPGEAGRTLTISALGGEQHGKAEFDANGQILFTPEIDYAGEASFDYTVTDSGGLSTTARFTLNLANINDAPSGVDEETDSDEDVALTIRVGRPARQRPRSRSALWRPAQSHRHHGHRTRPDHARRQWRPALHTRGGLLRRSGLHLHD